MAKYFLLYVLTIFGELYECIRMSKLILNANSTFDLRKINP